jgi:hypothetical protein
VLRGLCTLVLTRADVPAEGLAALAPQWWLRHLTLHCSQLNESTMGVFDRFHHLESLTLLGSLMTPREFDLLQRKLPHVRMRHAPVALPRGC